MMAAVVVRTTDDVYWALYLVMPENLAGAEVDSELEEKSRLWTYFADEAVQPNLGCCEFAVKIRPRRAEVGVEVSGEVLAKNEKIDIRTEKEGGLENKLTL